MGRTEAAIKVGGAWMSGQYPQVQTQTRPATSKPVVPAKAGTAQQVDRRARLVLRRLDPWSVLKFSLLFYSCLMLIGLLVLAVLWFVLTQMGFFDTISGFADKFTLTVQFSAGQVFRWYVLLGVFGVVLWSVVTVLLTLLFNLVNDVTGGIEVVLAERERRPPVR
ncbi:MAG TPA: DUF3566 domain-containing protein [Actinomycetota bacterium]